jgi:hypothetical protein
MYITYIKKRGKQIVHLQQDNLLVEETDRDNRENGRRWNTELINITKGRNMWRYVTANVCRQAPDDEAGGII